MENDFLFGLARSFIPVRQAMAVRKSFVPLNRPRPIEETGANRSTQSIYRYFLYRLSFISFFIVLLCHALAALGFGSSLPFCAEKRSVLLHESEEIFVTLLGKYPFVVTKARQLSWCCAAILRANK
jgi:hypothetical protein